MNSTKLYTIKTKPVDHIIVKDFGEPAPILWCNGGIWGLVDKHCVRNMIQLIKDSKSIPAVHTLPEFKIYWEETIHVPTALAEAICQ